MPSPADLSSRVKRAAKAAENAGLTAEADDLHRLAFDIEELSAPRGISHRVFFEIAELGTPRRLKAGDRIYAAGEPSPDFFLIVDGRVSIERDTPLGRQSLGSAGSGDLAGAAEALLAIARLGQAVAQEDTRLFAVPAAELFGGAPSPELAHYLLRRLGRCLRGLNDEFGKFFPPTGPAGSIDCPATASAAALSADEKSRALARGGLDLADVDLLASFCREEAYPQGTVIFREGDVGHSMSVIVRGKVRISRRIAGVGEEAFAILEPGAIFGEMAAFEPDAPIRSADAIAHSDCALLTLDRSVIGRLRTEAPAEASALLAVLCRLAARRIAETSERLVRWRMMAGMF
jgi:CRP/FNR family cyclic AMP-dependent transcriptional regulator